MPSGLKYETSRLFSPSREARQARFLHDKVPHVISLDEGPEVLHLHIGRFRGPPDLGFPATEHTVRGFNPSIVPAPVGLCSLRKNCAFVAAVRADVTHQCSALSPIYSAAASKPSAGASWFKQTAIALLDREMRVLAWTWFISRPERQVAAS